MNVNELLTGDVIRPTATSPALEIEAIANHPAFPGAKAVKLADVPEPLFMAASMEVAAVQALRGFMVPCILRKRRAAPGWLAAGRARRCFLNRPGVRRGYRPRPAPSRTTHAEPGRGAMSFDRTPDAHPVEYGELAEGATCPYDGKKLSLDDMPGGWQYKHCPGCGNEWTTAGTPTRGSMWTREGP